MAIPFSPSEAIHYQLCIDIRPEALSLGFTHLKESTFNKGETFPITGKTSIEKSEELQQILKNPVFDNDFGEFTVSITQTRNTLVPVSVFNDSKSDKIFKLNFKEANGSIDYNRIPELDIVNIYETPDWMKRKLVIALPRVRFFHQISVILKAIFNQPTFKEKVHLFIEDQFFHLLITGKNQLQYFNTFTAENFNDIIYHLLFVLEQKEIRQEEAIINILKLSESYKDFPEKAQKFFKNKINQEAHHEAFGIIHQRLCV